MIIRMRMTSELDYNYSNENTFRGLFYSSDELTLSSGGTNIIIIAGVMMKL